MCPSGRSRFNLRQSGRQCWLTQRYKKAALKCWIWPLNQFLNISEKIFKSLLNRILVVNFQIAGQDKMKEESLLTLLGFEPWRKMIWKTEFICTCIYWENFVGCRQFDKGRWKINPWRLSQCGKSCNQGITKVLYISGGGGRGRGRGNAVE